MNSPSEKKKEVISPSCGSDWPGWATGIPRVIAGKRPSGQPQGAKGEGTNHVACMHQYAHAASLASLTFSLILAK